MIDNVVGWGEKRAKLKAGSGLVKLKELKRSEDVNDLQNVRLIGGLLVCAVEANHLVAALAETAFFGFLDAVLENAVDTDEGGDLEALDSADDLHGLDDVVVDTAGEDRDGWAVLAHEASDVAGVCQNQNEVAFKIEDSGDSGGGDGFGRADGLGSEVLHVAEEAFVVKCTLSFATGACHDANSVQWILAVCSFAGEHDCISAIEHGVGDVRGFSTGRSRGLDHRLKHLSGCNDWLGSKVGFLDHPLLRDEDFLRSDLHAEVATSNHDTVSCCQDFVVVVETLLVFNLGDDLYMCASCTQDVSDRVNVLSLADERCSNHINALLDKLCDVFFVLLGECGQVDDATWQVHVLLLANFAVVFNFDFYSVLN